MKFFRLIPYYVTWHYTGAIRNIVDIWGNYIWFILNYFSIKVLFFSFFKPYRSITEKSKAQRAKEMKLVTFLMRIVGVVLRLAVITVGVLAFLSAILIGTLFFFLWLALPIILFIVLIFGVVSILK